ncbi:unnamed protein product, partial [Staurois parvus]
TCAQQCHPPVPSIAPVSAQQCRKPLPPISADYSANSSVPSMSATYQCCLSVSPICATSLVLPLSAAYQCCLSVPISAAYQCSLINAHQ